MRKIATAFLVVIMTVWGVAHAASFGDGVESGVRAIQTGAYVCFSELRFTLEGYQLKHLEGELEAEFKSNSEIHPVLISSYRKGFQLKGLDDPALEGEFKACIDREVKEVLKAVKR